MEENKSKAPNPEELAQKLATLEELLVQQKNESRKQTRYRQVMAGLMLALVVVFAIGLWALNHTVSEATREVPQLVATTTAAVEEVSTELEQVLTNVEKVDFDALNSAIMGMEESVEALDVDALNKSLKDLQEAAEGLAKFTRLFG